MKEIGVFPERNKLISLRPKLTDLADGINYHEIFELLQNLKLTIYTPLNFVLKSALPNYLGDRDTEKFRKGRELGIQRIMAINLLKRMESSVHSFMMTVEEICGYLKQTSLTIENFEKNKLGEITVEANPLALDGDDQNTDFFTVGKKTSFDLRDMDYISWKNDIDGDIKTFAKLVDLVKVVTPEYDFKLNELKRIIREKVSHPINEGNRKVLVFTAFSDTAEYLYANLSESLKNELGVNVALVTGDSNGRTNIPNFKPDINHVLSAFSPRSKDRDVLYPNDKEDIDILIATDCISEGQNLQDCDYCVNYDIHWNPVRIVQRFGRIDRIGSKNKVIQLVNFWPDLDLDEYINLKERVETRMRISVMTATGDDDLINQDEKGDLEYRRKQLKKLQEEVVDLEDMESGVSIVDLGLNEFRMDLLAYIKQKTDMDHLPFGIYAVVKGEKPGVIFVLKNTKGGDAIKGKNRLYPFYMVYVANDGEIIANHLQPKDILDMMRLLAKGKTSPNKVLCDEFNEETRDGCDMGAISRCLEQAIDSIVAKKEESDVSSFLNGDFVDFKSETIKGLDDFELICFLVVR